MNTKIIQKLIYILFISQIVVACTSMPSRPDTKTPEQKRADLQTATVELQGRYDVVESRNDDFNSTSYRTQKADVKMLGEVLAISLSGSAGTLIIYARDCKGLINLSNDFYSLFCFQGMPRVSHASLSKSSYDHEIESGAMLGGFKPLQVRKGDYLLSYTELPRGRSHYYLLRKAKENASAPL